MAELNIAVDAAPAVMHFLTVKLGEAEVAAIQKAIPHREFVAAWKRLESDAKELSKKLLSKEAAVNSGAWKILSAAKPEALLYLDVTGRNKTVDEKIKNFFGKWRQVQEKIADYADGRAAHYAPASGVFPDLPGGIPAAAGRQASLRERDREISRPVRAASTSSAACAGAPWTGAAKKARTAGCQSGRTAGDCSWPPRLPVPRGKRSCREFQARRISHRLQRTLPPRRKRPPRRPIQPPSPQLRKKLRPLPSLR